MIDWSVSLAAIWRNHNRSLRAVRNLDPVTFDDLLGYATQQQKLRHNTERFLQGKPSNHVLLWGGRGTGKSSLIKALLNTYASQGLRMVEVEVSDLRDLPEILDAIENEPFRFVIFCDDVGFSEGDGSYRHLKSVLEGSLELPPPNVRFYATANRRHLMPERMSDNAASQMVEGELHPSETIEDKISLADRFGLNLSFYPMNQEQYLAIVDQLFGGVKDRQALHLRAARFATERGGRSGRTARQFFNQYSGEI